MIQYLEQLFRALITPHQIPVWQDPARQRLDPEPLAQADMMGKDLITAGHRQTITELKFAEQARIAPERLCLCHIGEGTQRWQ